MISLSLSHIYFIINFSKTHLFYLGLLLNGIVLIIMYISFLWHVSANFSDIKRMCGFQHVFAQVGLRHLMIKADKFESILISFSLLHYKLELCGFDIKYL